jgi:hypothetical protein
MGSAALLNEKGPIGPRTSLSSWQPKVAKVTIPTTCPPLSDTWIGLARFGRSAAVGPVPASRGSRSRAQGQGRSPARPIDRLGLSIIAARNDAQVRAGRVAGTARTRATRIATPALSSLFHRRADRESSIGGGRATEANGLVGWRHFEYGPCFSDCGSARSGTRSVGGRKAR